jgi:hypothetical protein
MSRNPNALTKKRREQEKKRKADAKRAKRQNKGKPPVDAQDPESSPAESQASPA